MSQSANAAQIEYWNTSVGHSWAHYQELLDRQIAPLGQAAIRAAVPKLGERVLDVGCGCGETTLALAEQVGETGRVTGVDISRPMLDVAERRAAASPQASYIAFIEADAQTADLGAGGFDLIFSRFGVMFFADPTAAFANLRRLLKPGGRLSFVCWRPYVENRWMSAPAEAVSALLPPSPPTDPLAPGPFAFADPQRISTILSDAGFNLIQIDPHDQNISAGDMEAQVTLAYRLGPLGSAARAHPELIERLDPLVRASLETFRTAEGVQMPAACWIVQARNPA